MNGAIYYAGFVAIRLSQATRSTYFANTVKTHPFCTDASKQNFFFFYSVPFPLRVQLQCSNSTNRSTIDPLYWQLVCSPNFVTASFSPNEIHLFLLWNCVLIQQIYLSIYLKLKIVAFHPLSTKIETSTNAKLRLRFKRSRIYRFPSPRFRALVIEF